MKSYVENMGYTSDKSLSGFSSAKKVTWLCCPFYCFEVKFEGLNV